MPGFNQRGPLNEGPMTGGMKGVCTGVGNFRGAGAMGRRMGRRGCRRGGYAPVPGGGDMSQQMHPASEAEDLKARARFLEEELSAVKKELERMPDA